MRASIGETTSDRAAAVAAAAAARGARAACRSEEDAQRFRALAAVFQKRRAEEEAARAAMARAGPADGPSAQYRMSFGCNCLEGRGARGAPPSAVLLVFRMETNVDPETGRPARFERLLLQTQRRPETANPVFAEALQLPTFGSSAALRFSVYDVASGATKSRPKHDPEAGGWRAIGSVDASLHEIVCSPSGSKIFKLRLEGGAGKGPTGLIAVHAHTVERTGD
jgi:hypothetical protein